LNSGNSIHRGFDLKRKINKRNRKSVSIVEKGAQRVKRVKNEEEEECDVVEREKEEWTHLQQHVHEIRGSGKRKKAEAEMESGFVSVKANFKIR